MHLVILERHNRMWFESTIVCPKYLFLTIHWPSRQDWLFHFRKNLPLMGCDVILGFHDSVFSQEIFMLCSQKHILRLFAYFCLYIVKFLHKSSSPECSKDLVCVGGQNPPLKFSRVGKFPMVKFARINSPAVNFTQWTKSSFD